MIIFSKIFSAPNGTPKYSRKNNRKTTRGRWYQTIKIGNKVKTIKHNY
jgi:hypothetical protein